MADTTSIYPYRGEAQESKGVFVEGLFLVIGFGF
jgi:hypothetical protein